MKQSTRNRIGNCIVSFLCALWIISCSSAGLKEAKNQSVDEATCKKLYQVVVDDAKPVEPVATRPKRK